MSTLEAYAQGKKELFKGLALEKLEKDWTVYPVLHLDLNTQKYDTPESLTNVLEENVQNWEALYGASSNEIGVARRFQGIIRRACEQTGRRVVILIDEYDKPMLQAYVAPYTSIDFDALSVRLFVLSFLIFPISNFL